MGKKSTPAPPDYTGAAQAQAESSQKSTTDQTWANRPDQNNPWGSSKWQAETVKDPTTGQDVTKWTQNTTVDPRLQGALDSQVDLTQQRSDLAGGMFDRAAGEYGQPMDWSKYGSYAGTPQGGNAQTGLNFGNLNNVDNAGATRQRAEDAIYQSATSRLDPRFQQQQTDMETQLANQGISRNSAAYTRAMDDFGRNKNDAYAQAQQNAITGGGAEAQRDYGMDMGLRQQQANEALQQGNFGNAAQAQNYSQNMSGANYQNQLRQNQIQEDMQRRGFSLNEINSILSGQQVSMPQFGGFGQASNAQPTNYLGAAQLNYEGSANNYNAQQGMMGNMMGGLGGIIGGFNFSDRRVKTDIKRIGRHPRGFGVYRYRYIGETRPRVGFIAQEVRRFAPELVRSFNGVLAVNYLAA